MSNEQVIRLAYGKEGIDLHPDGRWNLTVVEPHQDDPLSGPAGSLLRSLKEPMDSESLKERIKRNMTVGIIFNDITRPTPNQLIIEAILSELTHIPRESVTLFNALGTHRPNTEEELREMLGDYLVDNYRIVQNNAFDRETQAFIGTTSSGNEVWLNKDLLSCDLRVLTGFIEPHFFAGFSGGGKAVMPGMAGLQTIMGNHGARNIADSNASWGITDGNPIWEEVREVLGMTAPNFLVNIALNAKKEITRIFAGEPFRAHDEGIAYVRDASMVAVGNEFDIVVTTNSGYPLDLNLYQAVKGMSAAARIVEKGGVIISVADCWDGIPEHGNFGKLLLDYPDPEVMLREITSPGFACLDQWQAQILAQIRLKADIYLYSDHLSEEQLSKVGIGKCTDIRQFIETQLRVKGKNMSVCVLPEGPQTIPYVT